MRTADEIVAEFDEAVKPAGMGEGHFQDFLEPGELRVLIDEIKRLNFTLDGYIERYR